jgi:alpha-N-arabinofuranosidase
VTFGNGVHGAIPPRGATVTATYDSGPHGGFVEFYRAMKRMNPRINVCETEEGNTYFLRLLGKKYRYDCVELHEYAAPKGVNVPLGAYEQDLMSYPAKEASGLARLQKAIKRYSGRNVPVYVTEYGQLVWPVPLKAPKFLLSLGEALFNAAQVREWALGRVKVAEKYVVTSSPFLSNDPRRVNIDSVLKVIRAKREGLADWDPALSIDSAMVAGPGPRFVAEPSGEALGLTSTLAGERLVRSSVTGSPLLPAGHGQPALLSWAASGKSSGHLLVINSSPSEALRTMVSAGPLGHGRRLRVSVLDGPSIAAFNTVAHPRTVRITTRSVSVDPREFVWTFPAHSVTLFRF